MRASSQHYKEDGVDENLQESKSMKKENSPLNENRQSVLIYFS